MPKNAASDFIDQTNTQYIPGQVNDVRKSSIQEGSSSLENGFLHLPVTLILGTSSVSVSPPINIYTVNNVFLTTKTEFTKLLESQLSDPHIQLFCIYYRYK